MRNRAMELGSSWEFGAIVDGKTRYFSKNPQSKYSEAELIEDILRRIESLEGKIASTPGSSETARRNKLKVAWERADRYGSAKALEMAYERSLRAYQRI